MKIARFLLVSLFLAAFSSSLKAQVTEPTPDQFDVVLGFDLVISQDYHDIMEQALSAYQVTGGYGWLGGDFGLRYKLSDQFSVTPSVALWINFLDLGTDIITNTIVLPGISVTYQFQTAPSFYARGELNYNFPNMDLFPEATGGVGMGATFGYCFDPLSMELGYLTVPVDVLGDVPFGFDSTNMGGLIFKTSLSF